MYFNGLFNGVKYKTYLFGDDTITRDLDDMVSDGLQNNVVSITMIPSVFVGTGELPSSAVPSTPLSFTVNRPNTIAGYEPKNNKMFTFPFCYLAVDCINDAHNYRFEYFNSSQSQVSFEAFLCVSPNSEIVIAPTNYNGSITENRWEGTTHGFVTNNNFTESLTMTGFPQCAFVIDSYRAWLAQKATGQGLTALGSLGGAIASGVVGYAPGVVAGIVGFAGQINQMHIDATQNTKVRGNIGSDTLTGIRRKKIYFKIMTVTRESAEVIDNFFSKYGYACSLVKVPNRHVRQNWTYTKTVDCEAKGAVPIKDMEKIKNIYNNGITFWSSLTNVGNYSDFTNPVIS